MAIYLQEHLMRPVPVRADRSQPHPTKWMIHLVNHALHPDDAKDTFYVYFIQPDDRFFAIKCSKSIIYNQFLHSIDKSDSKIFV